MGSRGRGDDKGDANTMAKPIARPTSGRVTVEVKIGVQYSARELIVDSKDALIELDAKAS